MAKQDDPGRGWNQLPLSDRTAAFPDQIGPSELNCQLMGGPHVVDDDWIVVRAPLYECGAEVPDDLEHVVIERFEGRRPVIYCHQPAFRDRPGARAGLGAAVSSLPDFLPLIGSSISF